MPQERRTAHLHRHSEAASGPETPAVPGISPFGFSRRRREICIPRDLGLFNGANEPRRRAGAEAFEAQVLIIPAVDLKGGKCVRLIQGRREREIVYGGDPVAMGRRWVEAGAKRLHLIDLDGDRGRLDALAAR